MTTVLHLLAQRPSATGSGVTIEAMVASGAELGLEQFVACGLPEGDATPPVGGLSTERIHPLRFGTTELPFVLPGMSDVMPYASSRFSALSDEQWGRYRDAWRTHLGRVIDATQPDVIHAHHVWLMSSLVKELAPEIPLVIHSHATGLRQMVLCPNHADEVRVGCARADHFCVLHTDHKRELIAALGVAKERVSIVGAGYREELFHARGREVRLGNSLLYVGKLSAAKGVSELLLAFADVCEKIPDARLHVVGSGSGSEGEWISRELAAQGSSVIAHGQLDQSALAELMRQSKVCVLPSFYEGLPLVLVEAAASGCSLVSTALPGVVNELAPHLGNRLRLVAMPPLETVDRPRADAIPQFVRELSAAMQAALKAPDALTEANSLEALTWRAVVQRVEKIWAQAAD